MGSSSFEPRLPCRWAMNATDWTQNNDSCQLTVCQGFVIDSLQHADQSVVLSYHFVNFCQLLKTTPVGLVVCHWPARSGAMAAKNEMPEMLSYLAHEKICLSCYMVYFEKYLSKTLGLAHKLFQWHEIMLLNHWLCGMKFTCSRWSRTDCQNLNLICLDCDCDRLSSQEIIAWKSENGSQESGTEEAETSQGSKANQGHDYVIVHWTFEQLEVAFDKFKIITGRADLTTQTCGLVLHASTNSQEEKYEIIMLFEILSVTQYLCRLLFCQWNSLQFTSAVSWSIGWFASETYLLAVKLCNHGYQFPRLKLFMSWHDRTRRTHPAQGFLHHVADGLNLRCNFQTSFGRRVIDSLDQNNDSKQWWLV